MANNKSGISLIAVYKAFGTTESCLAYLEAARWPEGVRCVVCGSKELSKFVTNETTREITDEHGAVIKTARVPARHLYQCNEETCRFQFSATAGTIFDKSHLPLPVWFQAVALIVNAKKSVSAKQMQRDLGVNYRTAWHLNHRIREAMQSEHGLFSGTVEADETFVGGKYDRRRKRERCEKQPVFGAVQRGTEDLVSQVRAFPIPTPSTTVLTGAVRGTVSIKADLLVTDQWRGYKQVGKEYHHETVNHIALEYVRKGDPRRIHTNSIENFWSLFKRGVIGSFHQVSVKHLHRYLNEFSFRFNGRESEDLFGLIITNLVIGTALRYKTLTAKASAEPPDEL
jgi:hypothetical protein